MDNRNYGSGFIRTILQQFFLIAAVLCLYTADYLHSYSMQKTYIFLAIAIINLIMTFVMMGFLAKSVSSFHGLSKVGADVMFVVLTAVVYFSLDLIFPLDQNYMLADRLIIVGVVAYLLDSLFLIVFSSITTRMRTNTLIQSCVLYKLVMLIQKNLFEHTMFTRALRGLISWMAGIAGVIVFLKSNQVWGLVLLALSIFIELYYSLRKAYEEKVIRKAILQITQGDLNSTLDAQSFHGEQKQTAEAVNHIRDGLDNAVQKGIKNERMKADLITNVSHDLKTPLTSIINYVNILKEKIPETEDTWQYLMILDEKSQRLKTLLEDLLEVSRLTSGTVKYEMNQIDFLELIYEIGGEYDERFEKRGLIIVTKLPRLSMMIKADGRQLCRAIENLYTNAAKYAKMDTHVNVELRRDGDLAVFSIRNVMAQPIQFTVEGASDLTERFVRGDRSRTTEGSGLGLSITKEIVTQMGGTFEVFVEEDVYNATISFKIS